MASTTKVKVNYEKNGVSDGSKTFNNLNPEASNENLVAAVSEFTNMQDKTVKEMQRIDTTVISG